MTPSSSPISSARRRALVALVAGICLTLSACGGSGGEKLSEEDSARLLYVKGVRALAGGDYEKAAKVFGELAQFPQFMRYAALGKLRLGDTLHYQERYLEAMEVYQEFLSLYPRNPNVPYARYMSARSLYARVPANVWFFSPAERLDMSRVLQARDRLRAYIRAAPESPYAFEASELLRELRQRLYAHHRHVAGFYGRRDADRAEAGRRADMAAGYPEWGATRANLLRMHEVAARAGADYWKRMASEAIQIRFPKTYAADASLRISSDPEHPPEEESR